MELEWRKNTICELEWHTNCYLDCKIKQNVYDGHISHFSGTLSTKHNISKGLSTWKISSKYNQTQKKNKVGKKEDFLCRIFLCFTCSWPLCEASAGILCFTCFTRFLTWASRLRRPAPSVPAFSGCLRSSVVVTILSDYQGNHSNVLQVTTTFMQLSN